MEAPDLSDEDRPALPLNVPHVEIVRYARTFLRMVVCELRFPTLFELDDRRPPSAFAMAVRRSYPLHEMAQTFGLGTADMTRGMQHEFRTQAKDWVLTLRQDAVVLQTTAYTTFDDFLARLKAVIVAAVPVIDTPFFTRVGLRYINHVPFAKNGTVKGWINSDLVGALSAGHYGQPFEHNGRVIGRALTGQYILQHGYKVNDDFNRAPTYVIDCDMSHENVLIDEVATLLPKLNQHAVDLFHWALGDEAKAYLAAAKQRS
jgi:uncharacterized protein (TIGR04255 family)